MSAPEIVGWVILSLAAIYCIGGPCLVSYVRRELQQCEQRDFVRLRHGYAVDRNVLRSHAYQDVVIDLLTRRVDALEKR